MLIMTANQFQKITSAIDTLIQFVSKNKPLSSENTTNFIALITEQEIKKNPKLTELDVLDKIIRKYPGLDSAQDFLKIFYEYGYLTKKEHLEFYIKYKIVGDIDLALKPISHINKNFYNNVIEPYIKLTLNEKLKLLNENPTLKEKLQNIAGITSNIRKLTEIINFSSGFIKENALQQHKQKILELNQELKTAYAEIVNIKKQEFIFKTPTFKKLIESALSEHATKKDIDRLIRLGLNKDNLNSWKSGNVKESEIISTKDAYISLLVRRTKSNMSLSEGEYETLLNILSKEIIKKYPDKNLEKIRNELRKKTRDSPEKLLLAFRNVSLLTPEQKKLKIKLPKINKPRH